MNQKNLQGDALPFDLETNSASILSEKLLDALTPGLHVEFDPDEAATIGAFIEDALSEEEASLSCFDSEMSSFETQPNALKERRQ